MDALECADILYDPGKLPRSTAHGNEPRKPAYGTKDDAHVHNLESR